MMVKLYDSYRKCLQIYKFAFDNIGSPLWPGRHLQSLTNRHEIRFKVSKYQTCQYLHMIKSILIMLRVRLIIIHSSKNLDG